jgi:hypothetical protein
MGELLDHALRALSSEFSEELNGASAETTTWRQECWPWCSWY